jgi:hypothetical protein
MRRVLALVDVHAISLAGTGMEEEGYRMVFGTEGVLAIYLETRQASINGAYDLRDPVIIGSKGLEVFCGSG